MTNAKFQQQRFRDCSEHQGLNGRLVITTLTDSCVVTLTTALTSLRGGAPAGRAGAAKTAMVKDSASCGDGFDFSATGVVFSGVSESGFWGCIDGFKCIHPEVLSVLATQIKTIQIGFAQGKRTIDLVGSDVASLPTIGYFGTMNTGYAGRSGLPDNFKALFRPVVMI